MRKRPFELWLIWQNVETRQRYHVGKLLYQDGIYTFSYETSGYRRKLGYIPAFYSGWMYEIIQKNATTKQKLKIFIPKRYLVVKSTFQLLAS